MQTYIVKRPHVGDIEYNNGDERQAAPADVEHLVMLGCLELKAEMPVENKAGKPVKNKAQKPTASVFETPVPEAPVPKTLAPETPVVQNPVVETPLDGSSAISAV
jgi:hypothetical protein